MNRVVSWLRRASRPRDRSVITAVNPSDRVLPGLFSYGRNTLPNLTSFDDIPVVPVGQDNAMVMDGGPVWPQWEQAAPWRHMRSGLPVDKCPSYTPDTLTQGETEMTWGGHAVAHFGHFVVEHSTRILQSVVERPDLDMLFTVPPGQTPEQLPSFFWQILDWYGVSSTQVKFVTKPQRVKRLWAATMAEQWAHVPTSDSYLDLLQQNTERNGLRPKKCNVVYVTRDRMERSGEGHNAGEPYLTALLEGLGVTVIRPETMPLRRQLEYYAGAKTLIFSEGSAMHGRQLLGHIDQDIVILNRRPKMRIGLAALQPRCRRLNYAEVTRGIAAVLWPNGLPWAVRAISIYDTTKLLQVFAAFGVPLDSVWQDAEYERARDSAIRKWISIRFDPKQPIAHAVSNVKVRKEFKELGLAHLLEALPAEGAAA